MNSTDFEVLSLDGPTRYPKSLSSVTTVSNLADVNIIDPLVDGQVLQLVNGKWTNVDPSSLASGSAVIQGFATANGTGFTTVFAIAHGFGSTPSTVFIEGNSQDAEDNFTWSVDATNITVTYAFPPPAGTNNLSFYYRVS